MIIVDTPSYLNNSLRRLGALQEASIVLNPVENYPFAADIAVASGFAHGLYNTDKDRTREEQLATDAQFAGRRRISRDMSRVYRNWAEALGAADVTMRLLSGLHAHIVLFMALGHPGERVLLVPEIAGGHASTPAILERLGFDIVPMSVDIDNRCIDREGTLRVIRTRCPNYVFVDRSEGLEWESFDWLTREVSVPTVYDGSQYLTNILTGTHASPFAQGFNYLVATTHKNFPGPQKALLATATETPIWRGVLDRISRYVSNFHSFGVYAAGLTLGRQEFLRRYAEELLTNATVLESELSRRGLPIIRRRAECVPTHHVWLGATNREEAFDMYCALEQVRIYVNFRKLPYALGFGLRLGTSAITRLGIHRDELEILSDLIRDALRGSNPTGTRHDVRYLAQLLWGRAREMEALS